jgi:hypothetical protein
MKPLTRIILVLTIILVTSLSKDALAGTPSEIKTKYPHLFVLKSNRKYAGATVEVYYSNGDLVISQKINKRKMIIDFCDTRFGEYTIRVTQGDKKHEFQYSKK